VARPEEEVIPMRRILLTGLAFCTSVIPAMAADVAPAYVPPPLAWSWTGFYVGANVGWAGSTDAVINHGTDTGPGGLGTSLLNGGIPGAINLNQTGFIGGGQVGYNWQVWPTWVVGIEADFQGADAKGSNAFTFLGAPGILPITTTFTRELDWLGTLRGRFGYLWFPSLLLYGTGGLAHGENKIGTTAICPAWTPPCQSEGSTANQTSNTSAGFALGAGAEWRFAPAWSVRGEYLYVEFGRYSNTISYAYGGNQSTLTSTVRECDNIVRFGVNYMFY
jgi:outer membrane immunogenic protein